MTNARRGIMILAILALIGWGIYEMRKPWTYSAKAFSGRVVDAATGESLAGVNVAVFWELRAGREVMGYMEIDETVTDEQGEYSFPAWGPKWRPYRSYLSSGGRSDLNMIVFKTGYKFEDMRNTVNSPYQPIREVSWDGETISLEEFKDDLLAYDQHIYGLSVFIRHVIGRPNCNWRKIERLVTELIGLYDEVKKTTGRSTLPSKSNIRNRDGCLD